MASNRLNFGKIVASAVYKNGDNSFIRINGDFTSGSPNVTSVVNNVGGAVNFSEALIGVQCEPDKVTDISNKIASLEHTRWVIATTGSYDIFCLVALESSEELGNFIRLDIGSIEGIIRTETFVNLSVAKREYGA